MGGATPPVGLRAPRVTLDPRADAVAAERLAAAADPDFEDRLKKFMEEATPEERYYISHKLNDALVEQTAKRTAVATPDGKKTSLWKFAQDAEAAKHAEEHGIGKSTMRSVSRAEANASIPSEYLRRGYHKMQLRPEEERALGLSLIGADYVYGSSRNLFGKQPDFSFGIYAHTDVIRRLLGKRYAGQDPNEVLGNDKFYQDVIACARKAEMTLLVVPRRDLPMEACARAYRETLQKGLLRQFPNATEEDKADVDRMVGSFRPDLLLDADWVTPKGMVKKDTHFIFTTGPDGRLSCEAIGYTPNKDKRATFMGLWKNPKMHRALLDCFLGTEPLSETGRIEVANGCLYVANGFSFYNDPSNPRQRRLGWPRAVPPNPVELLTKKTAHFSLSQQAGRLLDGVSAKLAAWQTYQQARLAA